MNRRMTYDDEKNAVDAAVNFGMFYNCGCGLQRVFKERG